MGAGAQCLSCPRGHVAVSVDDWSAWCSGSEGNGAAVVQFGFCSNNESIIADRHSPFISLFIARVQTLEHVRYGGLSWYN